jgi:hypothetical protein
MGITAIDLNDIPLDKIHTSKYFISGVGGFNCKNSKIEISLQITSNDSIIKIVPDDLITTYYPDAVELVEKAADALDLSLNLDNDHIKNTLLKFITEDKIDFFPEEQIYDLLLDASSLTDVNHEITPSSSSPMSYNTMFNRTDLRIMDSSKIILKNNNNNNDCYRHPPIGKNMLKLNLEENDSKYISIKFNNRFLSWLCCRWILLLYKVWNHHIILCKNQSAEIPHWAILSSYTFIATMISISDNNKIYNNISCTLSFDHPFEIRTSTNEIIKLHGLCSLVISSDSQLPKSYIMNIEVISYSMTGMNNVCIILYISYIYICLHHTYYKHNRTIFNRYSKSDNRYEFVVLFNYIVSIFLFATMINMYVCVIF